MLILRRVTRKDLPRGQILLYKVLQEYYKVANEARPLSGFSPTDADYFIEMHFYS